MKITFKKKERFPSS